MNANTPIAKSTQVHRGERGHRRPVGDAGDRPVAGRPDEERQRLERLDDRRQRGVAVDEVAGEQDDEPERRGRACARGTARWRTRRRPRPASSRRTGQPGRAAAENEISSPGRRAKAWPRPKIARARIAIAKTTAVTCPASFSSAIERRACGVDASRSRLPLAASPASVPDSARTGHSPSITGRKLPTRQDTKPPSVSRLIGSPSRPRIAGGSAVRLAMNALRSSTVAKSGRRVRRPGRDHEERRDAADEDRRPAAVADASCRRSNRARRSGRSGSAGRGRARRWPSGGRLRRSDAPRTGRGRHPRGSVRG